MKEPYDSILIPSEDALELEKNTLAYLEEFRPTFQEKAEGLAIEDIMKLAFRAIDSMDTSNVAHLFSSTLMILIGRDCEREATMIYKDLVRQAEEIKREYEEESELASTLKDIRNL